MTTVALAAAGALLVLASWVSAARTVLALPARASRLARWTARLAMVGGVWLARRVAPDSWRRGVLDASAPATLLAMAACWLAANWYGFQLLNKAIDVWPGGLEWLSTALLSALIVVYLAGFMAAYSRRDRMVAWLGELVSGQEDAERLLLEFLRTGSRDRLDALFREWGEWAAAVRRDHDLYPALLAAWPGRQPCWVKGLAIVLDAAALTTALAPRWSPPHTRPLLDAGTHCLRSASDAVGIGPIHAVQSMEWREENKFPDTATQLAHVGLPVERGQRDARSTFQRLRVGYTPYASAIGERLLYGTAGPPPPDDALVGPDLDDEEEQVLR